MSLSSASSNGSNHAVSVSSEGSLDFEYPADESKALKITKTTAPNKSTMDHSPVNKNDSSKD